NVTSPIRVSANVPQSQIKAGATMRAVLQVDNNLSTPLTVQLNATSSFTSTGQTSSTEVSFNSTELTIPPRGTGIVNASITPDASLPSGTYAVGLIASSGNVSTI